MASSIAVGLPFAPNNPNPTFPFLIAFALLVALGLRFTYYAYRNRRTSGTDHELWNSLVLVGLFAVGFALLGLVEVLTVFLSRSRWLYCWPTSSSSP